MGKLCLRVLVTIIIFQTKIFGDGWAPDEVVVDYVTPLAFTRVEQDEVVVDCATPLAPTRVEQSEVAVDCTTPPASMRAEQKVPWLFIVYMAADNNLHYFAWSNIKQMASLGSNEQVKIVVQLQEPGAQKKTQRYLIEQNKALLLNQDQVAAGQKLDSGSAQTLIDFCSDAIDRFPARHVALIFWNHGTGCLDPLRSRVLCINEHFRLNPVNMMLELNRSDAFVDSIDQGLRAICFDETYHSYLSNQKIMHALQEICKKRGGKLDIIGLDACMMQMLEVGTLLQPYAHYMVGSQEVELGAGWNYKHILAPFAERALTPAELSSHIVASYQKVYSRITHDYTLSAINLDALPVLERAVNDVGAQLTTCLDFQINHSVKRTLAQCRSKRMCTHFDEPSYVDLGHVCQNILSTIGQFSVNAHQDAVAGVRAGVQQVLALLPQVIFANVVGKNLPGATGLSIYFPENRMHTSYPQAPFAQQNKWMQMLARFLAN